MKTMSIEELGTILAGAPHFAKYYMHDKNMHGGIGFYSEKFVIGHHNKATSFKLSDIRAELSSRYEAESKQRVDELNKSADEAIAALNTFSSSPPRPSKTIDKSVCLSDSAKNDTQSDFSSESDWVVDARILFESTYSFAPSNLKRNEFGNYENSEVQCMWAGFLMRTMVYKTQEQSVIERLKQASEQIKAAGDEVYSSFKQSSSMFHRGESKGLTSALNILNSIFPEVAVDD